MVQWTTEVDEAFRRMKELLEALLTVTAPVNGVTLIVYLAASKENISEESISAVLVWKLFDSCRVHFVRFQSLHVFMLVEKRYPLTPATITEMLNKKLQLLMKKLDDFEDKYQVYGRIVGIKRLLDDLRVTAAQVCVTTASTKIMKNMLSS
ncbi:hypothetical protein Tco_0833376 [Tanacetum coccineum]